MRVFKARGVDVCGIDFLGGESIVEGCLWDHPPLDRVDWIFCCDVMEHLPPEKVGLVLDRIFKECRKGGYFQIHHREDRWIGASGKMHDLHLTIRPLGWWTSKLIEHGFDVTEIDKNPRPNRTGYFVCV